ncbi:hypothetical protein, partial [Flavobacterium sp. W22_SRS_FP1]|uniref:hypothetical protein n=1 Tax=Flavobacterium sp. W22_SRS_FP1 TaxID=3240276 RepID=UPI003F8F9163
MKNLKKILFLILLIFSSIEGFSQNITLTNFNGGTGTRYNSCTNYNIQWTSSTVSGYYNIYYSVDSGATWTTIATSYQTISGSFPWTVPNVSSVNAKIKITDAQNENVLDISDNVFIIDGALILLYPKGGENFIAGNQINLIYEYAVSVLNVKIEYSVNDGVTWQVITNSTTANGSYSWTVPNIPNSNLTKLRITDLIDSTCKKFTMENKFSITSFVNVLNPNGEEILQARVGAQGTALIMNNGPEKINTASFYDNGGLSNTYSNVSYVKTIKPDFPTNKLKVKFQDFNLENGDVLKIFDGIDETSPLLATLTLIQGIGQTYTATNSQGALTFKFISDGDANVSSGWDALITSNGTQSYLVQWNIVATSKYFNIDYSINSGTTWIRVVSNFYSTDGLFYWQVPNTPTSNARIRVTDANYNSIVDSSNADFTILPALPYIKVNYPNGGENFFPGTYINLGWESAFFNSDVKLDYSIDNGINWSQIVNSTPSITGYLGWLVPNTPSTNVLVKVSDPTNSNYFDKSDLPFTINNYIRVTTPNGGTSSTRCSNYAITWLSGGASGAFKLEYSTDDTTWNVIENSISPTPSGNTYTYNWTFPNVLTTNLKVRVSDAANSLKTDTSDTGMSVVLPANPVRILSANGGEMWTAGTTQNITYTYGTGTTSV